MKKTAMEISRFSALLIAAQFAAQAVFAGGAMECRFTQTRGPGGGGGAAPQTCRAWVIAHDALTTIPVHLKVKCSTGFRLHDENARQFDREGDLFTVGVDHDRMALLKVHGDSAALNEWHRATLLTSSDGNPGYLSSNYRYKGACRMVDAPAPEMTE